MLLFPNKHECAAVVMQCALLLLRIDMTIFFSFFVRRSSSQYKRLVYNFDFVKVWDVACAMIIMICNKKHNFIFIFISRSSKYEIFMSVYIYFTTFMGGILF